MLASAIGRYDLQGVCFSVRGDERPELREILAGAGFERLLADGTYETWIRSR
jgi:hypothetical protein